MLSYHICDQWANLSKKVSKLEAQQVEPMRMYNFKSSAHTTLSK